MSKRSQSRRKDRAEKPWGPYQMLALEGRISELETALGALWALWNDKDWCRYKADYMRGHLSYAGMLDAKESPIRSALPAAQASEAIGLPNSPSHKRVET